MGGNYTMFNSPFEKEDSEAKVNDLPIKLITIYVNICSNYCENLGCVFFFKWWIYVYNLLFLKVYW